MGANRESEYRYLASLTPTPSAVPGRVSYLYDSQTPQPTALHMGSGAMGRAVYDVQVRLYELGYYTGALDGQFGQGTKDAVVAFQERNHLSADGIVGQDTWDTLMSSGAQASGTAAQ